MANISRLRFPEVRSTFGKSCLLFVFLIALFPDVRLEAGAWTRKADINPSRVTSAAAVIDGKIYLMGGMGDSYLDTKHNYLYDPATDTWQKKADMPTARSFVTAVAFNGIIYTVGGSVGGLSARALSVVEAYNPATDSWTTKKNLPNPRFGMNTCVVDSMIYSIGGKYTLDSMLADTYAYDPATDTWTSRTSRPLNGSCAVAVYNGLIYTFGGRETRAKPASSGVYAYDPKTDTWTRKNDMPTPRHGLQASVWNDKIYVIGGYYVENNALAAVEVYDPANDSWEKLADMPEQTALHAQAEVGGRIYAMAGSADFRTGGWHTWEFDPAFHTDVAAGNVSGNWTIGNSPYQVNGEVTVPDGQTLQIEPGVDVTFMGHYKLNVQGRLLAVGTAQDTIHFTADNLSTGWHGIRFIWTPDSNDTSKIVYCSLRNGKANTGGELMDHSGGALFIRGVDKVLVSHSVFEGNMNVDPTLGGAAIYIDRASPTITHNSFSNNAGTADGAIAGVYSNAVISNNIFSNNNGLYGPITFADGYCAPIISGNHISYNSATMAGGGIITVASKAVITNNIITHNQCSGQGGNGGGISLFGGDRSIVMNNTIAYNSATNGGGVLCSQDADPILINNIIWENTADYGNQVSIADETADPSFLFSDIQGGKEGFGGTGAGANYNGLYENNIDHDPLFLNATSADYSLTDASPCIGAGIDTITIAGVFYDAPPFCIAGRIRPYPAGSNPDIGACEHALAIPTGIENETVAPEAFALLQNYPNPFNPTTVIAYTVGRPGNSDLGFGQVRLSVYDILGREVAVLVNERQAPGHYEVEFDGAGLTSGVYFYRLKADGFTEAKRMMLLR